MRQLETLTPAIANYLKELKVDKQACMVSWSLFLPFFFHPYLFRAVGPIQWDKWFLTVVAAILRL